MNFIITLIPLFFAWALLSAFYNFALRPVMCDIVRFRLFCMRDKLRKMAIDGDVRPSSFNFVYLEKLICRTVDKCAWFSWSSFFEFAFRHPNPTMPVEAQRFLDGADDDLKAIHTAALRQVFPLLLINSPIMTIFLVAFVSVGGLFGAAWKQWLKLTAGIFVEEQAADGACITEQLSGLVVA